MRIRIPWRRVFQFRLRTLLIVLIAVAAVMGQYRSHLEKRAEAAAKIYALGGRIDVFSNATPVMTNL